MSLENSVLNITILVTDYKLRPEVLDKNHDILCLARVEKFLDFKNCLVDLIRLTTHNKCESCAANYNFNVKNVE